MLHIYSRLSGPSGLPIDSSKTVQEYNHWRFIANDGGEELKNRIGAIVMMCEYLEARGGQQEAIDELTALMKQVRGLPLEEAHKLLDKAAFPVFVDTAVHFRSEIPDVLVDPISQVLQDIKIAAAVFRGNYFQFLTDTSPAKHEEVVAEWNALEVELRELAVNRLVVDAHEKLMAFLYENGITRTTKKQSMIPPASNGNGNGHAAANASREVSTASST